MRFRSLPSSVGGLSLLLCVYGACLLWLLPKLSLWLDEILGLISVRAGAPSSFIAFGGVPLGYLTQFVAIHLFGPSTFSYRIPAVLFSLLACVGIFIVARCVGSQWPVLAAALFAVCPLQFRYALEARMYSQALCLSIWATVAFLAMIDKPRPVVGAASYAFCIAAGLYTQPYTFFVPVAHCIWVFLPGNQKEKRRPLRLWTGLAMLVALLAFLPWALYANQGWQRMVGSLNVAAALSWRTSLLLLRELVGGGYIGTVLVLLASGSGLRWGLGNSGTRRFWALVVMVPIAGAVLADAASGYFPAVRQIIFVLAPLSVLSTLGIEALWRRERSAAAVLTCALLAGSVFANVQFFRRPRDNWLAGSSILAEQTKEGACTIFAPPESRKLYTFFSPELKDTCSDMDLSSKRTVALAVSPYDAAASAREAEHRLRALGFLKQAALNNSGPRIEIYRKPSGGPDSERN